MKKLIPVVILFMCFSHGFGQTTIDSDIVTNTVWTKASSPFLVNSPVTVLENITLTIEPGVVIKNNHNSDILRVNGTVIAEGTAGDPIVFTFISDDVYGGDSNNDGGATVPEAGNWGSIEVRATSSNTTRFQHCIFRFGGRLQGALFADNSSPQVSDCLFQNCKYGFETNGTVSPSVLNNQFEGITMLPVIISLGSTPVFSGNSFNNNALIALGLKKNNHGLNGDAYTLKKINLAGIDNIPYVIEYRIDIPENTTLTIEPGVVLKNYNILDLVRVYGTIIAEGTTTEPIVFTFISDDEFGGDSNNDGDASAPEAGDWESIEVMEASSNTSRFQHCLFRFGGRIDGVLFADNSSPQTTNCLFQNCKYGFETNGMVSHRCRTTSLKELPCFLSSYPLEAHRFFQETVSRTMP